MAVVIKEVHKGSNYTVNGKDVYQDSNGNWVRKEELTAEELKAFREAMQNNFTTINTYGHE